MDKEKSNVEIKESGLQCDNPTCDWTDKTITFDNYKDWLNRPCPKCGQNVLTAEDYANAETIRLAANFINSLSPEDLNELNATIGAKSPDELKEIPIFKDAKGMENLQQDGDVIMTLSSHKKIKVEEIKKAD